MVADIAILFDHSVRTPLACRTRGRVRTGNIRAAEDSE